MKNNNICKFIPTGQEAGLSVSCFILETDPDVIHKKILLTAHRMILAVNGGAPSFSVSKKYRLPQAI